MHRAHANKTCTAPLAVVLNRFERTLLAAGVLEPRRSPLDLGPHHHRVLSPACACFGAAADAVRIARRGAVDAAVLLHARAPKIALLTWHSGRPLAGRLFARFTPQLASRSRMLYSMRRRRRACTRGCRRRCLLARSLAEPGFIGRVHAWHHSTACSWWRVQLLEGRCWHSWRPLWAVRSSMRALLGRQCALAHQASN